MAAIRRPALGEVYMAAQGKPHIAYRPAERKMASIGNFRLGCN
jgi:hypothetical protein